MEKYINLSVIGKGAFATVSLVEHRDTKQQYACKEVTSKDPKIQEMALKEIKLMKKVNHNNIIELENHCTAKKNDTLKVYLFMKYYKDGTLNDYMLKKGTNRMADDKLKFTVTMDVASALDYLHSDEIHIAHRDLKPSNILIEELPTGVIAKVCDFGVARMFDPVFGKMTTGIGTEAFAAPEQLAQGTVEYNEKCDIFAFAIILLCLIKKSVSKINGRDTLAYLLNGDAIGRHVRSHKNVPKFVTDSLGKFSSLKNVMMKMLAINPNDRPKASDVLANLSRLESVCKKASTGQFYATYSLFDESQFETIETCIEIDGGDKPSERDGQQSISTKSAPSQALSKHRKASVQSTESDIGYYTSTGSSIGSEEPKTKTVTKK